MLVGNYIASEFNGYAWLPMSSAVIRLQTKAFQLYVYVNFEISLPLIKPQPFDQPVDCGLLVFDLNAQSGRFEREGFREDGGKLSHADQVFFGGDESGCSGGEGSGCKPVEVAGRVAVVVGKGEACG